MQDEKTPTGKWIDWKDWTSKTKKKNKNKIPSKNKRLKEKEWKKGAGGKKHWSHLFVHELKHTQIHTYTNKSIKGVERIKNFSRWNGNNINKYTHPYIVI